MNEGATMHEMTVGERESYKGKSIVCFLDLLGFSKVILEEWNNTSHNPLNTILNLKKAVTDYENSTGIVLKLNDHMSSRRIKYVCNTRTISDSIIITVPIDHNLTTADVFFSILGVINSIARFWGMALGAGYTIRGGIDYGDIYWDKSEIIGPAFINAYSLEANVAKTSRIVCSDEFAYLVSDICNKAESMSLEMTQNFIIDIDGLLCLNPHILYDASEDKEHFIKIVTNLMSDKPQNIKHKYLSLQKILKNKESLHIPTLRDLELYTSK
jgi:hypothetical protein